MAKQRKTIGTGITAREVVTYDGEDMIPGWLELDSQWEAKRQKRGGNYGAVSLHIIEWCHQIIADSGTGLRETDSLADFAERIIQKDIIAQAAIKRGHAGWAAKFAYEVGLLAEIEWAAVCDGCPPHELGEFVRHNRDRCMAVRDRWLEQQRAWLKDWL
jgi:hypothetical protein